MKKLFSTIPPQKKNWIYAALLTLINLLLFNLFNRNGGYNMRGVFIPYSFWHHLKSSIFAIVIGLPILSYLLSFLFALVPANGLKYWERYHKIPTLTLIVINLMLLFLQSVSTIITQTASKPTHPTKQTHRIDEFKEEILSYKDSMVYYMDQAIAASKLTEDKEFVSFKFNPKLRKFELKLDSVSRGFHTKLLEYGLTQQDYEKALDDVRTDVNFIGFKMREYERCGLIYSY